MIFLFKENSPESGVIRMSIKNRPFLIQCFICIGLILSFLSVEVYLHNKQRRVEQGKIDNWGFPLGICAHNGERISKESGVIQLALAPYTIYKNLPNQKNSKVTINAEGFRGGAVSLIPDTRTRVIVVGGSAAFGVGLSNDDETFEALLGKFNNGYEVINAGVAGFLSGQELTYVVTELVDYHPRVIIAYNGWNDLHESWYHETWFGIKKEKDEIGYNTNFFFIQIERKLVDNYQTQVNLFSSFQRFFSTAVDKSAIISGIREKMLQFKQKVIPVPSAPRGQMTKAQQEDYLNDIVDTYTKNLIKMHSFCKSQGIQFLVVFQPEVGLKSKKSSEEREMLAHWVFGSSNYAQEFPQLYGRFIGRSKEIINKNGVPYIDINTYPEFNNNSDTLFIDPVHASKKGNEIIARIINEYLKTLL